MCLFGKEFRLRGIIRADGIEWPFVGSFTIVPIARRNREFPTTETKRMLKDALSRYVGAARLLSLTGSGVGAPSSWSWGHGRFTSWVSG